MKQKIRMFCRSIKGQKIRPIFLLIAFIVLCSHDLYLKMDTYFLKPNQEAKLSLYNGTFEKSENIITRDRILDASILFNGQRLTIDASQWTDKDSTIAQFKFTPIEAATHVTGVSTKARNIELTAEKFNNYLEHDGVLDMLEYRNKNNLLDKDAIESYEKHVKAIYQVGETKTDDWKTVLGYPIEFVPQANPYEKYNGDQLDVKLLLDGQPLANQLVYANYIKTSHSHKHKGHSHEHGQDGKKHSHKHKNDEGGHSHEHKHDDKEHSHKHEHDEGGHSHEHEHDGKKHKHQHKHDKGEHSHEHQHDGKEHAHKHKNDKDGHNHEHEHEHDGKKHKHQHKHGDGKIDQHHKSKAEGTHTHTSGQQLRTNAQGLVTINLPEEGIYYLRTIHMVNVTDNEELTHQSKWATLTFEVTHKHDSNTHTHEDHEHEGEFPLWIFILGSVLLVGILFIVFRKKN